MLRNFRAYQMAVRFYHASQELKVRAPLKDQLARAASSVALNLAEGSGKTSTKDRLRFYEIALGSVRECEAVLDLLGQPSAEATRLLDQLARNVFNLCQALRS